MQIFKVGEVLEDAFGVGDHARIQIDDSGVLITIFYYRPKKEELNQISFAKFDIREILLNGVIFFTVKFGNRCWMDMPYHPNFSPDLTHIPTFGAGQGLSLTVVLADTSDGVIKNVRYIGLGHKFSVNLMRDIESINNTMSYTDYITVVENIYGQFRPSDLADLSQNYL